MINISAVARVGVPAARRNNDEYARGSAAGRTNGRRAGFLQVARKDRLRFEGSGVRGLTAVRTCNKLSSSIFIRALIP